MPSNDMTFAQFQELNARRCNEAFAHGVHGWPLAIWALAIAGEAGELANLVKKIERGDFTIAESRQAVLYEMADVMTYCFLLASHLDADAGTALLEKFSVVSERIGWVDERAL